MKFGFVMGHKGVLILVVKFEELPLGAVVELLKVEVSLPMSVCFQKYRLWFYTEIMVSAHFKGIIRWVHELLCYLSVVVLLQVVVLRQLF